MSIEPRESTHTSDEPNRYDRLLDELIEVKQSVANMSSAMNKLYDHVAFTVNYIYNQDLTSNKTVSECGIQTDIYPISTDLVHIVGDTLLRNTVCEIGTQTDVKQVNDNLTQNKVKEHIPSSFYELSTDLEGTKLDIVIMERRITSEVRENGQAIELMLKQNSALSDKVNSLSQGLEKLEANLHKIEPKHASDHPNQRSVHTKAKITKGHVAVNNKGLSGKLNPDTNNNQNHGHPSTSLKITHKPVFEENRVTTPRSAPPEWLKCLPLCDIPHNVSCNNPTNISVTKHNTNLIHQRQDGLEQLSNNSKHINDIINNKSLSGKSNPDTVNNSQNYGYPSISQKTTCRPVNGEIRVPTSRPAPPEWLKSLPLINTPYNDSSNNPVFRGIYGRRKTRWRSRREKNSVIANY